MTSLDHARKATITPEQWVSRVKSNPEYDWKKTEWWKALKALEEEAAPRPPAPGNSVFSGKGLFTTSDSKSAFGKGSDWTAFQMDPEGTPQATWDPASRAMYWMARPTQEVADKAARLGIPFIAQAEGQQELEHALSLAVLPPKALIGDPSGWTKAGFDSAAASGWDLLLEFYKNAQPWLQAPDAHGYPRFRNVVFGTYDASGEHPGQGGRVYVDEYRKLWAGSFSCWPAETMTDRDWVGFKAA